MSIYTNIYVYNFSFENAVSAHKTEQRIYSKLLQWTSSSPSKLSESLFFILSQKFLAFISVYRPNYFFYYLSPISFYIEVTIYYTCFLV